MVRYIYPFFTLLLALSFVACSSENSTKTEVQCLDCDTRGPVVISEVDPVNTVYKVHEGDDAGWIEIMNQSQEPVNLSGMSLTDAVDNPSKWTFGDVAIPPGGTMVVFLSGKDIPDYEAPHDTVDLIGSGCWTWTDSQNTPVAGQSTVKFLKGSSTCFNEDGIRKFGGTMQFGENTALGWHSISFFVGTGSSSKTDPTDLSKTNEILLTGYIEKDRQLQLRLAQPDVDDWKGWAKTLKGTGDSSYTYRIPLPVGTTMPDLAHIYGTRFSPEDQELHSLTFKVSSYIARNRGHEPHANFKLKKSG